VELLAFLPAEPRQQLVEDVVVLLLGQRADDAGLVKEVAMDLGAVESSIRDLHLDELANATGLRVGGGLGRAQGSQDRKSGGQVLKGIRFRTSAGDGEQLTEHQHRIGCLSGSRGARQDYGLRIACLALLTHCLLDDLLQLRGQRQGAGGGEGQGVAHVQVRIDGQQDRTHIRLKNMEQDKWQYIN